MKRNFHAILVLVLSRRCELAGREGERERGKRENEKILSILQYYIAMK